MNHWSDCSVNNEPALSAGDCDCGGFYSQDEAKLIWEYLRRNCCRVGLADEPQNDDWVIKNDLWKRMEQMSSLTIDRLAAQKLGLDPLKLICEYGLTTALAEMLENKTIVSSDKHLTRRGENGNNY